MSMLAEPRRKIKWTLNPRGKLWSDDTNKFGQRMLEKMGWREGKGLGANEQGIKSHIPIKVKADNKGVGFKRKGRDCCQHQINFAKVLSSLSQGSDTTGNKKMSLEETSRKSNTRLHFGKLSKAKDMSNYSKKDIDSILGPTEEELSSSDDTSDDSSCGINTVVQVQDSGKQLNKISTSSSSSSVIILDGSSDEEISPKKGDLRKRKGASTDSICNVIQKSNSKNKTVTEVPTVELEQPESSKSKREKEIVLLSSDSLTPDASSVKNKTDAEVKQIPKRKRKQTRSVSLSSSSADEISHTVQVKLRKRRRSITNIEETNYSKKTVESTTDISSNDTCYSEDNSVNPKVEAKKPKQGYCIPLTDPKRNQNSNSGKSEN